MTTINGNTYDNSNDQYDQFSASIQSTFSKVSTHVLFTTDINDLSEIFLENLPEEGRQHYNCRSCRRSFLDRFGGLVTISDTGEVASAIWDEATAPEFFAPAVKAMKEAVLKARVNGVFFADDQVLGQPATNGWSHMHVRIERSRVRSNASQLMALAKEELRILRESVLKYKLSVIKQALNLLQAEALYRSDRFLGPVQFAKQLHESLNATSNSRTRDNLLWRVSATTSQGLLRFGTSVIGTVLDDIVEGYDVESIKHRFKQKTNQNVYMRSQSAPTTGGVRNAERIVEEKGIAGSLQRKAATFQEVAPYLQWQPQQPKDQATHKAPTGLFGHLTTKNSAPTNEVESLEVPMTNMTMDKFRRTVLPTAESIEVKTNPSRFMNIVRAVDPDAPNILLWDNDFSWYYLGGGVDGDFRTRVVEAGGQYDNVDIRCSLIWKGYTDLDLHCEGPQGHIYYGDKRIGQGWLDIDMNGGSHRHPSPVENIRWAKGQAPEGRYKFYVVNYEERGNSIEGTPFEVELEILGKKYRFSGVCRFTRDTVVVFEFTYRKGQEVQLSAYQSSASGSTSWNVPVNEFVKVTGITESPNLWTEHKATGSGSHVFFLLEGCQDTSGDTARGFLAEMLQSEYREIRKVLDQYTAQTPLQGLEEASACGVGYSKDSQGELIVRVTSNGSTRLIKIDRWD